MKSKRYILFIALWAISFAGIGIYFFLKAQKSTNLNTKTCQIYFPDFNICGELNWIIEPNVKNTPASLMLKLTSQVDTKIQFQNIELKTELFMPDMGHGSSPVEIQKVSADTWKITELLFIMEGFWEIRFQISDPTLKSSSMAILPVKCMVESDCKTLN